MAEPVVTTYSLEEVAAGLCGDQLKDPKRWLLRRIYSGKIRATKIGRSYRMTPEQVEAAKRALETTGRPTNAETAKAEAQEKSIEALVRRATANPHGLTRTSARRRSRRY